MILVVVLGYCYFLHFNEGDLILCTIGLRINMKDGARINVIEWLGILLVH